MVDAAMSDRAQEEAAMAEWLAANKPKRLPKRSASAPPILAIRAALSRGRDIEFKRGKRRTVIFKSASVGAEKIVHDEGMNRRRRHKAAGKRNNRQR
ncbi:MAG TPA: hypothetical protein VN663_22750 [Ramlibacter sp.]|nr:hypothetical protein [Ramlibacter sp.]